MSAMPPAFSVILPAMFFMLPDFEMAREIMKTEDPLQCYKTGQNVSIQNKEWEKMALDIMFDGCLAKFEQNPNLCDFLLSTGTTVLLEASPLIFSGDLDWELTTQIFLSRMYGLKEQNTA